MNIGLLENMRNIYKKTITHESCEKYYGNSNVLICYLQLLLCLLFVLWILCRNFCFYVFVPLCCVFII